MFRTTGAPTWTALLVSCAIAACGGGSKANRPPSISAVSIAPASPKVTDELTAQATIADPDGDATTVTYRWTRNGSPITGQTGRILPRGNHVKGDVIEVSITANDSRVDASASVSVTIQDSPAQLTATPPTQVAYGEQFAFDIVATDADNDPIALSLLHGPAGMALSPTGRVTWTARLPLFGPTLHVNWAIAAATGSTTPALAGIVRVEDPERRYPLHRTPNSLALRRELLVANLDGSGLPEILAFGGTLYELGYEDGTFVQRWAHPFHMEGAEPGARVPGGSTTLAVGDVDGDGHMEIFAGLDGAVMKLDGATRRRAAGFDLPATCLDVFVADLSNDGSLEVVCLAVDAGGTKRIRTFQAGSGASIAQTAIMNATAALAVGNVDGDAALEIVTSDGLVLDSVGLSTQWNSGVSFGINLTLGDVDGDGIAEIVGIVAGAVQAFDAVDRVLQWDIGPFSGEGGTSAIIATDLNADGRAEIIVNDSSQTKGYRLNSATGQRELVFELGAVGSSTDDLAYGVGDLDGDGDPDLVKSYFRPEGLGGVAAGMLVASLGATAEITRGIAPGPLQDVTGGFWAELTAGQRRLVFGAEGLITLDPLAERYAWRMKCCSDGSLALGVFDVGADGIDDAFLGSASLAERYDAPSDTFEPFGEGLGGGTARAMVHGDFNEDGFDDFVAMTPIFGVRVFDVRNGTMLLEGATASRGVDIEVADLDGDGSLEIVGLYEDSVVVYDNKLQPRATAAHVSPHIFHPPDLLVTDSSGDGVPEIFVLADETPTVRSITQFSADLSVVAQFDMPNRIDLPTFDNPDVRHLFAEDLGTGRKNLIIGGRDGNEYFLRAVDPRTGALVWQSPGLTRTASRNSLHYVDTNEDGEPEIAFGSALGFYLTR